METRDIIVGGDAFRVTIDREVEAITDPRDWTPILSDRDVAMWRADQWEYVCVRVTRLHECEGHGTHETSEGDALGMVHLGRGDGWEVTIDDLIDAYPVPDMVAEILKGKE